MSKYTKLILDDYKYVIVNTSYTSRIASTYSNNGYGSCHEKFMKTWKELIDDIECVLTGELLFAYDNNILFKEGIDLDEVNSLVNIVTELGLYESGIACFRCDDLEFRYLNETILSSIYCRCFDQNYINIYRPSDERDPVIKYVSYDTESG